MDNNESLQNAWQKPNTQQDLPYYTSAKKIAYAYEPALNSIILTKESLVREAMAALLIERLMYPATAIQDMDAKITQCIKEAYASGLVKSQKVENVLRTLSPKEETVIKMRCLEAKTLEEVAAHFDVNVERIRQIEAKALRQMRAPERARRLRVPEDSSTIPFPLPD